MEAKVDIQGSEPSLATALEKLFSASQRVMSDRIDLALLDLGALATRSVRALSFAVAGAGLLLGGWFALVAAAVLAVDRWLPISVGVLLAALVNLALGLVGLALAGRAMNKLPPPVREAISEVSGSR